MDKLIEQQLEHFFNFYLLKIIDNSNNEEIKNIKILFE